MKTSHAPAKQVGGDVVLQEIWRIKDELSAARGHDVHRLFAGAREREKHSGHPVVSYQKRKAPDEGVKPMAPFQQGNGTD